MQIRSISLHSVVAVAAVLACACGRDALDPDRDPNGQPQINAPVVRLELPMAGISASGGHSCAVSLSGKSYCWGANTYGELGDGTRRASTVPVEVLTQSRFRALTIDGFVRWPEYGYAPHPWAAYTCGVDGQGVAYCWGDTSYGQLGTGTIPCTHCGLAPALTPQRVVGGPFAQLSAGDRHACGLSGGAVYCWGDRPGMAGLGWNKPELVPGITEPAQSVSAGGSHSCVLTAGDKLYCWGLNRWGEIVGDVGMDEFREVPTLVPGPAFKSIYAGDNNTCGLTATGRAYCWGRNDAGQIGDGELRPVCMIERVNSQGCASDPAGPLAVATQISFTALAVGQFHTCGLDAEGRAYCWGAAEQIGRSAGTARVPSPVETELRFSAIAAGARHTCAVTMSGAPYCWGQNQYGQLGNGTTVASLLPVAVANRSQ